MWPRPPLRAGHGAPHRGARAIPGHQAGECAYRDLGEARPRPECGLRTRQSSLLQGRPGPGLEAGHVSGRAAVFWTTLKVRLTGPGAQPVQGGRSFDPETLAGFSPINGASLFKAPGRPG